MIPVKIISIDVAKKLGFTKGGTVKRSGGGIGGSSTIITVNRATGKRTILEKQEFKNGKMELKFMHKDRTKYLKDKKGYDKYTEQFSKVSGVQQ